jgi:hypothetical protein
MNNFKVLILASLFSIPMISLAQNKNLQEPLKLVVYKDNVKAPLTINESAMLQEVYGENLEKEILNRPQRLKDIKNILRNRVVILDVTRKDLSNFKKLSEVPLFNVYNPSLKRDIVFNKTNFNPLKYDFSFYSRNGSYIRVDNTNYVIKIKSQHQR